MKHLLNDLSEEEKNRIREQHTGGKKIMIENFNKLINTKLGDARPLTEAETEQEGNCKSAENYTPIQEWVNFSNEMKKRGYVEEIEDHFCGSQKTPQITLTKNGHNISFIENIRDTMWLYLHKSILSSDYNNEYGFKYDGHNFNLSDKDGLKSKLDLILKFVK